MTGVSRVSLFHYLKLHWSIVPCEWDSDFQVGDTIDLSFQVDIIIIIANIVKTIITVIFLQPMFPIGASPDLVYADLDGPDHPICGSGALHR